MLKCASLFDTENIFLPYLTLSLKFLPNMTLPSIPLHSTVNFSFHGPNYPSARPTLLWLNYPSACKKIVRRRWRRYYSVIHGRQVPGAFGCHMRWRMTCRRKQARGCLLPSTSSERLSSACTPISMGCKCRIRVGFLTLGAWFIPRTNLRRSH
jgi:hypothetical protein